MKTYIVGISEQVYSQLVAIHAFIAADSVLNADRYVAKLEAAILDLRYTGGSRPAAIEARMAKLPLRQLVFRPYRVIFLIDGGMVKVLHIQHGAKKRASKADLGLA